MTKIYLELSDDIQQLFDDNSIAIEDILQSANIDTEIVYGSFPYPPEEGSRTKDLRPILVAVSIAVLPISTAISQVLQTVYEKPYFVEIYENQELRDANGDIFLDQDGQPLFKAVKRYELIEPHQTKQNTELEVNLNKENGILLKFKLEETN